MRCHVSQHHDARQTQVSTTIPQTVYDCRNAAAVHDQLGQLENTHTHTHITSCPTMHTRASISVCAAYLRCVFRHLPHQGGDVLPHVFIWVSEADECRRKHLGLDHHLCQADRVLADLAER